MARGAAQAQRKQRAKTAPKRKQAAPTYEQTMFFPRLRRQAKWVFVFLALVFGVGFVAFGVGSGSTGLGDILNGQFFGGGGSSTSSQIKDDQKKIERNPNDIDAQLALQENNVLPPGLDASSTFGQAFSQDPLTQGLMNKANQANTKAVQAFQIAEKAYKRVAAAARGTS